MPSSIEVSTCKPVSVHSVPHCSSVTSADVFNTDKMHIDLMLYQLLQLQRPALSSRQKNPGSRRNEVEGYAEEVFRDDEV